MNIDLRQAIIMRVKDKSDSELTDIIQDSIGADERALPGLGVLFEMIWQHSTADDQSKMVGYLHSHLHTNDAPNAGIGHS
ncbi:small acid-soluble spore protein SspI [Paenibacillus xylaniclasticus]|uniref:small acid-soluble spore protein SspI n=1 Tax=Paenibacillus xylaniclasticus TaxID=588083 RepID=UPI000FDA0829|nr:MULTISPECIES: small acid-soluble spore protein SspI [Paenibacillus]GFN33364.1 small, acid-soluble spore protein I [Paenibacillus curdlanolyticus]